MTKMTTSLGVQAMSRKMKYDINDKDMHMAMAPESRISRRPHESTIYHGGMVDRKYVMPLMPVIRMASCPTQPADSKTYGA